LSGLGQNLEESKQAKKERIEKAILELDSTISKTLVSDDSKYKLFKDQTNEMFSKLEDEQATREDEDEALSKEIKSFENQVQVKITKCKNARKEKESELLKQIDERAFSLTLDLAKSKK